MNSFRALTTLFLAGVCVLAAAPALATAEGRCGDPAERPWCKPSLSPDRRADLLLGQMTDSEKVSLLGGDELTGVLGGQGTHTGTMDGVPRLGIPRIYLSDGPAGVRSGQATALPSPIALGATFDRHAARQDAAVIADEVIRKGNDIVFAPTVDIVRTPLAGRVFEALGGEDPFLSTSLAVPWIKSAEGKGLIATVKHYLGNNQEGTGPKANEAMPGNPAISIGTFATVGKRGEIDARIDQRTMREMYLPMFEAAVKQAGVEAVMCAYNKVNGPWACENKTLLENILRKQWGFKGMTIADYGATHDTGASLRNGLDIEPWPGVDYGTAAITAALAGGSASMADVDRHVQRYLRTLFASGAMDREAFPADEDSIDRGGNAAKSAAIAEKSIVLLKNRRGILPLNRGKLDSIAVIGPVADRYFTGGGSSEIDPFQTTTALAGITKQAGSGVDVGFNDGADPAQAAQLAGDSDVAVVVVGSWSSEGIDRACLSLECPSFLGDQDALIREVAAANRNTVVVIESGGPILTPWRNQVGAILEAWYPGSNGGTAIGRILFGKADASGRLPVTFPRKESDIPTYGEPSAYPGVDDVVKYKEGVFVGYRRYDRRKIKPAYEFGRGLSYAKFRFSKLKLKRHGPKLAVKARVSNVGKRAGVAVPQLYLGLPSTNVKQPPRALKGFARISLKRGKGRQVKFTVDKRGLSFWNAGKNRWQVAKGCYRVYVGASSRKLPLRGKFGIGRKCR
ncbi:MAG: glycoside hydrolase family 3 C-terminal domain-containing protein [Solirubrobacterales bacterium]|nr:glycoside hydrolase family 3 C-terminal domain-containing protein [Solirubrobacterales bacterium]